MGYDPTTDAQEGETFTGPDSEAGGHRIHLVPSGACLGRDVPEAGQVQVGSWGLQCAVRVGRGPSAGQLGGQAEAPEEEGVVVGGAGKEAG